jgi:uncharacterized protein HemX
MARVLRPERRDHHGPENLRKDEPMKTTISMLSRAAGMLALGLAFAGPTLAADGAASTPRVDKRQARQEQRIQQGVASGELNQREAARLERRQGRIQQAEDKAKADGTVTAKERAQLDHMQDKSSRRIAKQKHDRQKAD